MRLPSSSQTITVEFSVQVVSAIPLPMKVLGQNLSQYWVLGQKWAIIPFFREYWDRICPNTQALGGSNGGKAQF